MNDVMSDPNSAIPEPAVRAAERRIDVEVGVPSIPAWLALCPYLLDATGAWRAVAPTTDHRCTAVAPPAPVSDETQRSLCLVAAHVECPVFRHARAVRADRTPGAAPATSRPIPLTAAVVLERPSGVELAVARLRESLPQVGLMLLIALAAAAVVLARVIAP